MKVVFFAALSLSASVFLSAEEKPPVRDLGEGRYEIGLVQLDQKTREITFPATINMEDGLLEFAIVMEKGKIHESLLYTKASALHLNIAFKLLRYQESPELFPILTEDFRPTDEFPEVSAERKAAARVALTVSWQDGEEEKTRPLNELIYQVVTEKTMSPQPWIYQGSYLHNGKFAAETSGDLAAIFITRSALLNFSGEANDSDEVWIVHPENVPPQNTPVTVTIFPYKP